MKSGLIAIMILVCFKFLNAQQNQINFELNDGSQSAYQLSDVRKIDFNGQFQNLHLTDGSVYSWEMNSIHKFSFDQSTGTEQLLLAGNNMDIVVFPNPSNGFLNIRFQLPVDETIRISLLNMEGKELAVIRQNTFSKGEHNLTYNASSISAGHYFIRISGSAFDIHKKIIIQ
jgi:hypothetical protein